ncbi:transcription antitermination factor NusB [Candidatus Riesia pediculischaeffi]|nr:transcription antitermination factor NusB [Candidatus Riesia pediculischaeffi]KIE63902.1 Transcription termination protein NusB [Candidatus Riesia pediculischaeffi PTSU]
MNKNKYNYSYGRHRSRMMAIQALYSWQITGTKNTSIASDFLNLIKFKKMNVDAEYFKKIFIGTSNKVYEIDHELLKYTLRNMRFIDQVERAILRLGVFELLHVEISYKIVIDEAVELSKKFCSEKSYKFINGVLDKMIFNRKKFEDL